LPPSDFFPPSEVFIMMLRYGLLCVLLPAVLAAGCTGTPTGKDPRGVKPRDGGAKKKKADGARASDGGKKDAGGARDKDKGGKAKDKVRKPVPPAQNPAVTTTADEGVIAGRVVWKGPVPETKSDATKMVVAVDGATVAVKPRARVTVGPGGGLAGVMVWLVKPPADPAGQPEAAQLRQVRGNFEPHVQVARVGSALRLSTRDDAADFQLQGKANVSRRVQRGKFASVPLARTGLVEVTSETRPWMTPAYVRVLDHRYHAVTGPDGRFALPAVPPGEYEVVLWHESWGPEVKPPRAQVTVKLGARQGAEVRWTLPR
jgi:hypothetical protein